jgi:hypothetical protein
MATVPGIVAAIQTGNVFGVKKILEVKTHNI